MFVNLFSKIFSFTKKFAADFGCDASAPLREPCRFFVFADFRPVRVFFKQKKRRTFYSTTPIFRSKLTQPNLRLSKLLLRLSPSTNTHPFGTVTAAMPL